MSSYHVVVRASHRVRLAGARTLAHALRRGGSAPCTANALVVSGRDDVRCPAQLACRATEWQTSANLYDTATLGFHNGVFSYELQVGLRPMYDVVHYLSMTNQSPPSFPLHQAFFSRASNSGDLTVGGTTLRMAQ